MDDLFSGIRRTFPRRPLVVEIVASGILFLWILWATSDAVVPFGHLFLIACATLALGGLWALHWIASLVLRSRGKLGSPLTAREWVAWVVLPALLFGGYAAARFRVPLHLRFALSRSAFEGCVKAAGAEAEPPARLGLYRVLFIDRENGAPHVATTHGFFDHGGFVRFPDGPPRDCFPYTYRHLRADWYTFRWND